MCLITLINKELTKTMADHSTCHLLLAGFSGLKDCYTPIEDYRKCWVWRVLAPYLVNIRRLSDEETRIRMLNWLEKCGSEKRIIYQFGQPAERESCSMSYYIGGHDDVEDRRGGSRGKYFLCPVFER